ncbi:UNVERIFIED_CONTAM: hypothetical protein GTU68_046097 [Idotea baltica]|nr:hypothetical protein [Idotea baltica]
MVKIRAGRKRPGLMRQHLTCVQAAAAICGAKTSEVELGSWALNFEPGEIRPSFETFAIGTAGSTTLLLQTILPILLHAKEASEVRLSGGTHVIKAPCFEYVDEIFLPRIAEMGAKVELTLERAGFFPAGGGRLRLRIEPSELKPCEWNESTAKSVISAEVLATPEIPESVGEKELAKVRTAFSLDSSAGWTREITGTSCAGNTLLIRSGGTLTNSNGERGKRAEQVAKEAIWEMQRYLNSPAPIDEHLADQLLLPLALAGGGGFTATALTPHFRSNVEVIEAFLRIKIETEKLDRFAWRVVLNKI